MIRLEHLGKRYGRFIALEDFNLEVKAGQSLALLGPNGAGKTTTIRALTGLLRPSSGRAEVNGYDVWAQPTKAKASFGYVPDRPYLYGKLSGIELLRFVAGLYNLPRAQAESRIESLLDRFALTNFASSLIETYSHGMRQKLTFCTALLPEPPVLIVDEPMVGLDPRAALDVRELLAGYAKPGRTVLFSTHQLELAEAVADRIAVVHHGQLRAIGTPVDIEQQGGLVEVFLRLTEDAATPALDATE